MSKITGAEDSRQNASSMTPDPFDTPESNTRPWWDVQAAALGTPEGLRAVRQQQQEGFFDAEETAPPPEPSPDGPQPISIWQPQVDEGALVFERPAPGPMGDHYAARRQIPAAKEPGKRRVCFFGESVAAGYLYAPHLTPAHVLERHLCAASGGDGYEVIDLARTNETLDALATTAVQAMQLRPDALVLFAGNNWTLLETPYVSPYAPSVRARLAYGAALGEAGVVGPIEQAARQVLHKAAATLARIAALAGAASIPVVLVIPEANLADWETRQPVVWLPGADTARWYGCYAEARDRLARGEWEAAARQAQTMSDLDGATCPTSFRLLAQAHTGAGDPARAEAASRGEIDAAQYATLGFLSAPQAAPLAQGLQRRAARQHGFGVVDLPEIFAQHTGTPLPGRRLFLDYCHLTVEGMHVAMAATAVELLRCLGAEAPDWPTLVRRLPLPAVDPAADAAAKFGAAVHTAHRLTAVGSRQEILAHWCRAALGASPGVEAAMVNLVAARLTPCPPALTEAGRHNLASPYCLTYQHGWHYDHLDADVIEAVLAVAGQGARAEIGRLLRARRLPATGAELAWPPFYLREPLEQFYPDLMPSADLTERAFYRAPWPVSRFCFIEDATRAVDLTLTARLPAPEGLPPRTPAPVSITINGQAAGAVEVGAGWRTARLRIPAVRLRDGLNDVVLHWPMPPGPGEAALEGAAARLALGLEADLHPVFGEVFSLHACPC